MAPTLATVADLAAHLQRDFDAADAYTADQALQAASAIVRAYLRQEVSLVEMDTVAIPVSRDGLASLPQRPVGTVFTVETTGGASVPWISTGEGLVLSPLRYGGGTVVVTYSHGYADGEVPADIRGVVLDVAARRMDNPRGLASENMGSYSYTRPQGSSTGLSLYPEEMGTLDRSALGRPGSGVTMLDLA